MGTVTDDGWIVMSGPPELQLGGEPELEFGGLGRAEPFVLFFPGPCNQNDYEGITVIDGIGVDLSKDFASWCHRGGEMEVHVYFQGEPVFVERLLADLQVRDLVPASG